MNLDSLKFSKKIDTHLEKLGLLGQAIAMGIALFVIFAPFFISYWIFASVFSATLNVWNNDFQWILVVLFGFLIQGIFYWLLIASPPSPGSSRFAKNIYDILGKLNETLNTAEKLGVDIRIEEHKEKGVLSYSADTIESSLNTKTSKTSECKIWILELLQKLNKSLKRAEKHDLEVSIKMHYWGPEKMKEAGRSKQYKYHFGANITAKK